MKAEFKARALRYASFDQIEDYLRQGWMISFPNAAMHHHHYGAELKWICECEIPGGFGPDCSRRVSPETQTQGLRDDTNAKPLHQS